jgi:hypothetical protein
MIQATEVDITYKGDGKQTTFSYPYPYRTESDIHGYLVDETGMETEITTNFEFDNTNNVYTYPVQGNAISSNMRIRLSRETPLQNNIDLPDKIPFSLIEKGMDWIVMMLQETIYRANLAPISAVEAAKQASLALIYAEKSANEASKFATEHERATAQADEATKQALIAIEKAREAGNYSATAYAASAKAWNAANAYNYPDVVAYTDGNTYRCIGDNIIGEKPSESLNWVKVTLDGENYFEIDETGNLMPTISPTYSSRWELDENGDIEPREVK